MRNILGWIARGSMIVAALLATIQPVLGSFALFRGSDPLNYETIHLVVGGVLYNFTLLLVLTVPFTRLRRRWLLFSFCLTQYVLAHIQLQLGLRSNENAGLLAYHIPVGVLVFFFTYLTAAIGLGMRLKPEQA